MWRGVIGWYGGSIKAGRAQGALIKGGERIMGGLELVVRAFDKADEALGARR